MSKAFLVSIFILLFFSSNLGHLTVWSAIDHSTHLVIVFRHVLASDWSILMTATSSEMIVDLDSYNVFRNDSDTSNFNINTLVHIVLTHDCVTDRWPILWTDSHRVDQYCADVKCSYRVDAQKIQLEGNFLVIFGRCWVFLGCEMVFWYLFRFIKKLNIMYGYVVNFFFFFYCWVNNYLSIGVNYFVLCQVCLFNYGTLWLLCSLRSQNNLLLDQILYFSIGQSLFSFHRL